MKQKKYFILLLSFSLLCFLASASTSIATDEATTGIANYKPLDNVPGFGSPADFPEYLSSIFSLAVWAAGISAMLMIMVGGYIYMTSAGNAASIEKAKGIITDAIIGLVLALCSWLLLHTINPDLTIIRLPPSDTDNNWKSKNYLKDQTLEEKEDPYRNYSKNMKEGSDDVTVNVTQKPAEN